MRSKAVNREKQNKDGAGHGILYILSRDIRKVKQDVVWYVGLHVNLVVVDFYT